MSKAAAVKSVAEVQIEGRAGPSRPRTLPQYGFLDRHDWKVARFQELYLTGHSWREIREMMCLEKPEFDRLFKAAVDKAVHERKRVEADFAHLGPIVQTPSL